MFDLLDLVPEEKVKEETSEEQNSTFWVVWSVLQEEHFNGKVTQSGFQNRTA